MLEDDYDVDLASIEWMALQPVQIPNWQPPNWLKLSIAPVGASQFDLLASGKIDAAKSCDTVGRGRRQLDQVRNPDEIDREVITFARSANGGLIVTASGMAAAHRKLVI